MEGDVIITLMAQGNGRMKYRPAIILRVMRPYGDVLICGTSTKLHQQVAGFDEIIYSTDSDFPASGLRETTLIRLGYLGYISRRTLLTLGAIGNITPERYERRMRKLSAYLTEDL